MKTKTKKEKLSALPAILIAAGGTGGHITPGISIAEAWLASGGRVVLATLMKNIDYPDIVRLARNEAVSIVAYDAPRLTKNPLQIVAFIRRFLSAYRLVRHAAKVEHVSAVLGMGGYSSFPAVFFAIVHRLPLYLCEQNARWGIVTRIARGFARRVFLAFAAGRNLPEKFVVTGNPLRAMFAKVKPRAGAAKQQKIRHLLIIGGSQGASDLNKLYLAFAQSPAAKNVRCTVATGAQAYNEIKALSRKSDTILPFIEDMPAAYNACDAVVARCGSGTLFEILWSQKPAFLIPYPFAAADHQAANAQMIIRRMPGVICDHRPFDSTKALGELLRFVAEPVEAKPFSTGTAAELQITRYLEQDLKL